MWFRLPRAVYERGKGARNRKALKRLVASGEPPGVLAYRGNEPVGWCAVAPRGQYPRLARSRVLRPIDERPVWSVVCLFVAREHRNGGVSVTLLRGAAAFAASRGARLLEGYPVESRGKAIPPVFAATGTVSAFRAAGFKEAGRGSPVRPIVRLELGTASASSRSPRGRD